MNIKMKKLALATILTFGSIQILPAKENIGGPHRLGAPTGGNQIAASCSPSTSRRDLDINNIRTPIFINGDMWWDLVGNAQYEVPKDSKKYSLFAGALWLGGRDQTGQLKVAAQTYRQSGQDFWPGPVDTTNASITANICNKYDRHWRVTHAEVSEFALGNTPGNIPVTPSQDIKEWPGNGDGSLNQARFLAPFHDANGDGIYDWSAGDYPGYNLSSNPADPDSGSVTNEYLLGDQTIWWVFNDVGNIHTETDGAPIGLEIQAQAFAFATNDDINNMTFYKYKIINRSALSVNETYFGAWVDPDLGNYLDDFVGCDVPRGFGYCYNGDAYDDGITGYGFNPPAVGYDFFQGPAADLDDGKDNDRDSCTDCTYIFDAFGVRQSIDDSILPELIIMSKFVYYNNDFSVIGNPVTATHYYNYMQGIWKDGNKMTYGGNGHGGGVGTTTDTCDFMFPGDSDPNHWGTNGALENPWDEVAAGNSPDDRRFLQSAGPFTLQPGAVNYITTGAVWGRAGSGGAFASVQLIRIADDKAQKLFDHNFAITNGPDAPDLTIRELDQELIFSITNPQGSNNFNETYFEIDPNLSISATDPHYHFEGYQVFQLKDATVTTNEIKDADRARLVKQFDIKNGVGQIVNHYRNAESGGYDDVIEVSGDDDGLRHVLRVTKDLFALGNDNLVNHKTYYYTVLAYGYNSIENAEFNYNNTTDGDGKPYLAGRRRIATYTAIPHKVAPEANGLILNTAFDDGPQITRLEGTGNGHIIGSDRKALDLTQGTVDEIILYSTDSRSLHPTYEKARGPVDIRVYDPVKIIGGDFELKMFAKTDTVISSEGHDAVIGTFVSGPDTLKIVSDTLWELKNLSTGQLLTSVKTLKVPYDQLVQFSNPNNPAVFSDYGFYVNMTQLYEFDPDTLGKVLGLLYPGVDSKTGGFVEATLTFANPNQPWLSGVPDIDNTPFDWIATGKQAPAYPYNFAAPRKYDETNTWSKLIGGTWAPYKFATYETPTGTSIYDNPPTIESSGLIHMSRNQFSDQASVDIVFTSDTRYWSKCVVIEQGSDSMKNIGRALKGTPRRSTSLVLNGNNLVPDPNGSTGFSYFPGYAINVETGERLNIAFGEESYQNPDTFPGQTGADMRYNPNTVVSKRGANVNYPDSVFYVLGGKHIVYVFGHNINIPKYDGGDSLYSKLKNVKKSSDYAYSGIAGSPNYFEKAWAACMWVGYTMLFPGEQLLSNKATVRIRMARPYEKYHTDDSTDAVAQYGSYNQDLPMYRFSTHGLVPKTGDLETAKSALDLITVVPNPYYAFSSYEKNQLDNSVKIINLPSKCTVSIYTPGGTLIRQLRRDVSDDNTSGTEFPETNLETALDWDLKNSAGIPIASGIYIIHINAPGIGEKTVKWFGVLRPIDLDTF